MFGGGGGVPAADAGRGLPFGGIPSELQAGVDPLLADEPDHGEPDVVFSQQPERQGRAGSPCGRSSLEYPRMLVAPPSLVVVISVAPGRPQADRVAIDNGHGARSPPL